jgi:hypothetical protein
VNLSWTHTYYRNPKSELHSPRKFEAGLSKIFIMWVLAAALFAGFLAITARGVIKMMVTKTDNVEEPAQQQLAPDNDGCDI